MKPIFRKAYIYFFLLIRYRTITLLFVKPPVIKINLCSGTIKIDGYISIDIIPRNTDIVLNLNTHSLPFKGNSVEIIVCISAINYFKYARAKSIIKEIYRVLKIGGIVRMGVQDMEKIALKYVNKDYDFFFEKKPDGTDRYEGATLGDKFASFFYGYKSGLNNSRYFYDYKALSLLFEEAGFKHIEKKAYLDSTIDEVNRIDNRPDQMFFIEAIK